MNSDGAEHLINELQKLQGSKKIQTQRAFICCPYHSEKTPSMSINLRSPDAPMGWCYCFGCGKSVPWNTLVSTFKEYRLIRLTPEQSHVIYTDKDLQDLDTLLKEPPRTIDAWMHQDKLPPFPVTHAWRGFPEKLLTAVNARLTYDTHLDDHLLVFPVEVNKQLYGYVKARYIPSDHKPNYFLSQDDGSHWVKQHGLFPWGLCQKIQKTYQLHYVVLVEGVRDALKLNYFGIPALAILGTNAWSDNKKRWVLRMPEINTVILMMDGDYAGESATQRMYAALSPYISCKKVNLRRYFVENNLDYKPDPANLPKKHIIEWRKRFACV